MYPHTFVDLIAFNDNCFLFGFFPRKIFRIFLLAGLGNLMAFNVMELKLELLG